MYLHMVVVNFYENASLYLGVKTVRTLRERVYQASKLAGNSWIRSHGGTAENPVI